jgi:hypothetical protein
LFFWQFTFFVCKAQENVNCYDIIKTEYHNTYDSLENIIKIDTIIYIRICAADESQENEMILRKKILLKGERVSYWHYIISVGMRDISKEYLFYSFIMAFKYNSSQAYYDLMSAYRSKFYYENFIDENTINQMVDWIQKAARRGHKQSRDMLKACPLSASPSIEEKIKLIMHN